MIMQRNTPEWYARNEPQHGTPVAYLAGITRALTDTATQSPNPYTDPFDAELWASGYIEGVARLTLMRQEIDADQG